MKNFVFLFNRKFLVLLSLFLFMLIIMFLFGSSVSLDTKIYYTGDQARALLEKMSLSQQQAYLITELADLLLLIPIYTAMLFVGLKQVYPQDKKMWLLAFIPTVFDVLETGLILYALGSATPQSYFNWLGLVTFFKWLFAFSAILTLLRGAVRRIRAPVI